MTLTRRRPRLLGLACVGLCLASAAVGGAPAPSPPAAAPDPGATALDAALRDAPPFVPLPPLRGNPLAPAADVLVPAPPSWWLPPAEVQRAPRVLPGDGRYAVRTRAGADLPPVAWESEPVLPAAIRLAAAPPASAPSPDPDQVPSVPVWGAPTPDQVGVTTDPTAGESARLAIAAALRFRHSQAPPLLVAIPDPFEALRAVQLRRQPPDDDPPARLAERPPMPPLPVKP